MKRMAVICSDSNQVTIFISGSVFPSSPSLPLVQGFTKLVNLIMSGKYQLANQLLGLLITN